MMSFFARLPYTEDKPNGPTLHRISTIVRAKQIAKHLGAKYNPTSGYENDVCVHLKPRFPDLIKDGDYVDVLDDTKITNRMKDRPGVNIIAMTTEHKKWLESFLPNKIVHIPHHHMNFKRTRRTRKEIKVCGYIGANTPMSRAQNQRVKIHLDKIGMEFVQAYNFQTIEDVVQFYSSIDIQVIGLFGHLTNIPYYHEKKIVDAMSFGIPTVAESKLGYADIKGSFLEANTVDEMVSKITALRNEKFYQNWSDRVYNEAERYHIDNISKLYKNLV